MVLYAGSLVDVMQNQIGPAFQTATGYTVSGISAGSKDLASEIKGKVHVGDVFISASPKVNASLEGSKNGDWVNWYLTFATSGSSLATTRTASSPTTSRPSPGMTVITVTWASSVGFTDPATDPKGKLVAEALSGHRQDQEPPGPDHDLADDKANVFPEETLVGPAPGGQLDAAFFYTIGGGPGEDPDRAAHRRGPSPPTTTPFALCVWSPPVSRTLASKADSATTSAATAREFQFEDGQNVYSASPDEPTPGASAVEEEAAPVAEPLAAAPSAPVATAAE